MRHRRLMVNYISMRESRGQRPGELLVISQTEIATMGWKEAGKSGSTGESVLKRLVLSAIAESATAKLARDGCNITFFSLVFCVISPEYTVVEMVQLSSGNQAKCNYWAEMRRMSRSCYLGKVRTIFAKFVKSQGVILRGYYTSRDSDNTIHIRTHTEREERDL